MDARSGHGWRLAWSKYAADIVESILADFQCDIIDHRVGRLFKASEELHKDLK